MHLTLDDEMDIQPTGQQSPTCFAEEEGEDSNHKTSALTQDPDQQLSED